MHKGDILIMNKNNWINITNKTRDDRLPKNICVTKGGKIFIDGELYDESKSKYKNLSVSVERHNKTSTGEETQMMLSQREKAKKGETITIVGEQSPNRTETTTIKY